ncbi:MAG: hypothetical protein WC028_11285 [Candidatus Obscuribacterales bacterium]|jgi:hypothetical protein
MTTTVTTEKTIVEANWNTIRIQEQASRVLGLNWMTTMQLLQKFGGEKAVTEFKHAMEAHKVEYFKGLGVKTPYELVKAIAEFDVNVYGSKVEIWGNEKSATLHYLSCGMFKALEQAGLIKDENREEMSKGMEACMTSLASKFDFTTGVEMCSKEKTATVTFTRK